MENGHKEKKMVQESTCLRMAMFMKDSFKMGIDKVKANILGSIRVIMKVNG